MADIISSLQLDKELDSTRVVVVKEAHHCSSSFTISCAISQAIKSKQALLLITTHNSYSHYQNAGIRMNYNLDRYVASGHIQLYDMGKSIVDIFLNNKSLRIEYLVSEIKKNILSMQKKHNVLNVVIDGICHLFDLQFSIRDVNLLCKEIMNTLRLHNNSFLLIHCNIPEDGEQNNVFANLLSHMAHTVVQVDTLSSGWSADVSGHLSIKHRGCKFDKENIFVMDPKPAVFLYKLFDKGVKLFAPGTV